MSAFAAPADIMGQMHADDMDLVRDFAANGSEAAFATLVRRHVNLVYSAALRRLGNPHEAEEVAQAVFIILARKAGGLRRGTILSGWLYQTAQLTAANFHRAARRRQHREQEAFMQFSEQSQPDVSWHRLSPLLEEAMMRLGPKERDAVVLRFFENRTVREVASALGLREDAAQKRVNRATDKLRDYFVRRGIQVSTAALLASIGTHAVQAAPVELGAKIAATAALKGAAGSGSMLTLIKTTLKIMAWTKAKTAIVVGASVLLAAGTTTVTITEVQHHRAQDWQLGEISLETLRHAPRETVVLPTKSAQRSRQRGTGGMYWMRDGWAMGINQPVKSILRIAHDAASPYRMVLNTELPAEKYDFLSNLPTGSREALQLALKKNFGVVGRFETRDTDVLLLKVKRSPAPGLRPSTTSDVGGSSGGGQISITGQSLSLNLVPNLEEIFEMPVIDQTSLTGRYDVKLKWHESKSGHTNPEDLKQALLDQLGLELVPDRQPIEMLIVEKAP
jgi:uncharacterized protein (TIGR03435 family)